MKVVACDVQGGAWYGERATCTGRAVGPQVSAMLPVRTRGGRQAGGRGGSPTSSQDSPALCRSNTTGAETVFRMKVWTLQSSPHARAVTSS